MEPISQIDNVVRGKKGILTNVRHSQYKPILLLTVPRGNLIIGRRLLEMESWGLEGGGNMDG